MVRKVMAALVICVSISFVTFAQYEKGDRELGFTAEARHVESDSYKYSYAGDYLGLNLSAGHFLVNGLSLEPEIFFFKNSGERISKRFIIGNISYTYKFKKSKVAPFIKLGIGSGNIKGNTISYFWQLPTYARIYNASLGLKHMISSKVAIKYEINHRNYKDSYTPRDGGFSTSSITYEISDTSLLVGLTLLLNRSN